MHIMLLIITLEHVLYINEFLQKIGIISVTQCRGSSRQGSRHSSRCNTPVTVSVPAKREETG